MGLSEQDRARLHTIEQALRAQYPGLARRLTRHHRPRRGWAGVGLVLLVVGVVLVLVPVGVVGWMLVVDAALLSALLSALLVVLAVIALGVLLGRLRAVARQISQDPTGGGPDPASGPDNPT